MSDAVIFRELPETFPERDKFRKPSIISSVVGHGLLILILLIVPMLVKESISDEELLITLVSPLPPPPGPPPPPPKAEVPAVAPKPVERRIEALTTDALVMPTVVPKEIARLIEEPIGVPGGIIGGVPGGVPGGAMGGVLGRLLSSNAGLPNPLPPPPPPPPPPVLTVTPVTPIRVGGNVREPRAIKVVPPVYPILAAKARVSGLVVLEATVTVEGKVEEIKVISGHLLLIPAAIDCVKQWEFEPTMLNGVPMPVILTAKVTFAYKPIS